MNELQPAHPSQAVAIFEPRSLGEGMELAKLMANSDLVPVAYKGKPGNVIIAMQMGYEVGLKPMQALQNISVINGRPCIWGDALLAIVQGSGKLRYIKEWDDGDASYCETQREGYPQPYVNCFTDSDAKAAGLLNKQGPWQTNKRRMRQMRARAFNLRDQFADVLKGLSVAEEVQDYPVNVTPGGLRSTKSSPIQLPKRKVEVPGKESLEEGVVTGEVLEDPFVASVRGIQQEVKEKNEVISEAQQKRLFAMASSNAVPVDLLKLHLQELGYASSKEIKKMDYEKICSWVENVMNLDAQVEVDTGFDEVEG